MAAKKTRSTPSSDNPGFKVILDALEKDKNASYADVKAKAEKKGLTVYPIMFGRAKALLGLVPSRKRGEAKAAREKAATKKVGKAAGRGPGRRGPGRPRKVVANGSPLAALEQVVAQMKEQERENRELRAVLEKVGELLERVV